MEYYRHHHNYLHHYLQRPYDIYAQDRMFLDLIQEINADRATATFLPGLAEASLTLQNIDTPPTAISIASFVATGPGGKMVPPNLNPPVVNTLKSTSSSATQVGGIIHPFVSPDQVELTFAVAPGYTSLVQGVNGLGPWKIAGILRVKNRSKNALSVDGIRVSLDVTAGRKVQDKMVDFKLIECPIVTVSQKMTMPINDVIYAPFEFSFNQSLPPSFDMTGIDYCAFHCQYNLKASLFETKKKLMGSPVHVETVNSYNVQVPLYNVSLIQFLNGPAIKSSSIKETHDMILTASMNSNIVYPGHTYPINIEINPKSQLTITTIETRFIEAYTTFETPRLSPDDARRFRLHQMITGLPITPQSSTTYTHDISITIPPSSVSRTADSISSNFVNPDGVWMNAVAIAHLVRVVVVCNAQYGKLVTGEVDLIVIVPTADITDCVKIVGEVGTGLFEEQLPEYTAL
ncbi:hypothetical protein HDU76_006489 [Blyttiomyces sp. JEL0837]|nr:hypothetical protein HDU76_006489 [Blyttiomyces sp. JEL0837]